MNEVFLMGKIETEIEFKFIINSKNRISFSKFTIITEDKQEININAYNEKADYCYSKLEKTILFLFMEF